MIYDITRTVAPTTAVFPGDTTFSAERKWRIEDGVPVNLTKIITTPHVGTHADAYFHVSTTGAHPLDMPLEAYIGRARVITVDKRQGAITRADLEPFALAHAERVLIHTWVSELPDNEWARNHPYLAPDVIGWLAGLGVVLIGVDFASVDDQASATLPTHKALITHGMVNLELLALNGVPDGEYELIALPLKLDQACGSPVRAILRA